MPLYTKKYKLPYPPAMYLFFFYKETIGIK